MYKVAVFVLFIYSTDLISDLLIINLYLMYICVLIVLQIFAAFYG